LVRGKRQEARGKINIRPIFVFPHYLPEASLKPSAIGPKARTGKNVRMPKIRVTPAVIPVNSRESVFKVPRLAGLACFLDILSAKRSRAIMGI
jgi:hypothetical protein